MDALRAQNREMRKNGEEREEANPNPNPNPNLRKNGEEREEDIGDTT